jgi:ketosteroid isomerase-like protein
MRKLFPLLLGIACGATAVSSRIRRSKPENAAALAEIRAFHQKDKQAAMAKDIKTLRSLWTEDCVLLAPESPPIVGSQAVWEFIQTQFQQMENVEILQYDQDFQEIKIIDDWAFEWGLFKGSVRLADDTIVETRSKLFRVLRRQPDSTWKCARSIWHDDAEDDE